MNDSHSLTVVNWNVQWVTPASERHSRIAELVAAREPDIICMTEAQRGVLPKEGHVITSRADYGYPNKSGKRRKVLLWSLQPWTEVDDVGNETLPGGRFVSGNTTGSFGAIRVIGVCIPWDAAHVDSGRRDRERWEDHRSFLRGLREILDTVDKSQPTMVVGDFNQTIPRTRAPQAAFADVQSALAGWEIVTSDVRTSKDRLLIDHVATTPNVRCAGVDVWCEADASGRLSDHDGTVIRLIAG